MHKPKPTDPNPSVGALEARLRALPQPAVPQDLERRLLASIPATPKARPRLRRIAPVVGLAAAACLVVVVVYSVAWHGREKNQVADLKPVHDNGQGKTSHAGNSGYFVWGRTVADFPDSLGPPGFAWPLAGTSPPASSCASRAISFD